MVSGTRATRGWKSAILNKFGRPFRLEKSRRFGRVRVTLNNGEDDIISVQEIAPVILCGGSGTRLWPVSRKGLPKQFIALIGEGSLYQQSASCLSDPGYVAPVIVTNSDFQFIATQQLADAGPDPGAVLIEPLARNTAPTLLVAALVQLQSDPDGLMLAAPSDHNSRRQKSFAKACSVGCQRRWRDRSLLSGSCLTILIPAKAEPPQASIARRQAAQKAQQSVPLKTLAKHGDSFRVQPCKAANRFSQINAQNFDIHQNAALSTYLRNNSRGFAGRQFIP